MALRGPSSEATSLAAFVLCVTWPRLQSGLTSMCARLTLSLSMVSMMAPSRRCTRRCLCGFALPAGSGAALPTRKTALLSWLRLWSFTSQPDRLYFHDGLTTNSHARICNCCRGGGGAVCSGSVGHMTETWSNVPDIVKAQNMLGFLASCRWPSRLDHWRPLPVQLVADVNDLFLYAAGAELQQQSCSSRAAAGSYAGMLRTKDAWSPPRGARP